MGNQKYLNIIAILSSPKMIDLLFGKNLKSRLLRKEIIFSAFLRGEIGCIEMLKNLFGRFIFYYSKFLKPKRGRNILMSDTFEKVILRRIFDQYPIEPINLLGYKLYYLPFEENILRKKYSCFFTVSDLVNRIIIHDQYDARRFLKNGAFIFDVGAHIGIFSLFAHFLAPNGKIIAFEPSSTMFSLLKRNIVENNLSNHIYPVYQAIGNKKATVDLLVLKASLGGSDMVVDSEFRREKEKELSFDRTEHVEMTTIDDWVKREKIDRVDFLKVDTEGYEKQVIYGAKRTIREFTPTIACAAYHFKNDKVEIPKLLLKINPNYKFKLIKGAEEVLIFWD